MKLESLPIWPRILAAKPKSCRAKQPVKVMAAVIQAKSMLQAGPETAFVSRDVAGTYEYFSRLALVDHYAESDPKRQSHLPARRFYKGWLPRSRRFSAATRDALRAAKDPKFRRALARKQAQEQRIREIVMHVAERYHAMVRPLYTSKYAGLVWSPNAVNRVEWDRYAKKYKYPCKYTDAGVWVCEPESGGRIALSATTGSTISLPALPASLAKRVALTEPHPVGLFCVPVDGQAGVYACMNANHGDKKWQVAGFCVSGHRVPECVARGKITLADIQAETNAEAQRIMIERFGFGRYLEETGATEIQCDDFGRLYSLPGGHKLARLLNSTANPDGTVNEYYLPVPDSVRTAHEAVAWSFGLTTESYHPAMQS